MHFALSIDLEDWYQGLEIPLETWESRESRISIGLNKIVEALNEFEVKATFFVVGEIARKFPELVYELHQSGHEIGSHSRWHQKIYQLSPKQFFDQEKENKAIIEDAISEKIIGFRAPYFSITRESWWALDILKELGYEYDSSISPVKTWRYGVKDLDSGIYEHKSGLVEFTPTKGKFMGKSCGFGGAYFRLFPYHATRMISRRLNQENSCAIFYTHPWEFDPHQPKVFTNWRAFLTHYYGLSRTENRFKLLLKEQTFITSRESIARFKALHHLGELE